jgi:hypothetical protein
MHNFITVSPFRKGAEIMTARELSNALYQQYGHDMSALQIERHFHMRSGTVKRARAELEQVIPPFGTRTRYAVNSVAAWYLDGRVGGAYR